MHKVVFYAMKYIVAVFITIYAGILAAYPIYEPKWTPVETKFLAKHSRQATYPNEYIAVIEVRNPYNLGKLTALRFIEWLQNNPNGVVAFPSGNTAEYFVKFLDYYKNNWRKADVQAELKSHGINRKNFPDTSNLKLVQIEEIYPITSQHYKKISNYILRHYVKILGLKKENVLLMELNNRGILADKGMNVVFMNGKVDLSIMNRRAASQLESWQQQAIRELQDFCKEYENKIRQWGGIDFFVGGLSYSGSLAFNEPGGRFDSKTHFVKLDYKTAACAAKDFGGIDYADGKVGITIGLGTMTLKPNAVMIIIASGQVKAEIVRDAVEHKADPKYPASVLQKYPNSRFYVTDSAAKLLDDRATDDMGFKTKRGWAVKHYDQVILHVATMERKAILSLTAADFNKHARGRLLLETPPKPLDAMLADVHSWLVKKIDDGLKVKNIKGNKILHTAPHHDDIVLGYYPLLENFAQKNKNQIVYFTSGFNSVPDSYILATINRASDWWLDKEQDSIFNKSYENVINRYRAYFAKQNIEQMNMLETTIAMKHLVSIYDLKNLDELKQTIRWLKDDYFPGKDPGDLDIAKIRMLKGMMRESEADRVLAVKNISLQNVTHLRSKFYSGREFMKTPRYETDVQPFINSFSKLKPDIIMVQSDPNSAPPITHYKVQQIIAKALRSKDVAVSEKLQVWGYRNIWFRYKVDEANLFIPVSEQMMKMQKRIFNSTFSTQRLASFPSPFYEGDFASLNQIIQREQLDELKVLLGKDFFEKSSNPDLKNAAGFIYINKMSLNEFFREVEDLQPEIDLEEAYIASKK